MKIGLFGGAFDPVHNAHMEIAENALKYGLDRIIFIPSGMSPYHEKRNNLSLGLYRIMMLTFAIGDNLRFFISNYETKQDDISYTINTVKYFKSLFPDDKLYWIIGSDIDKELKGWHHRKNIVKIVTVLKAGDDFEAPKTKARSTLIKELLKKGESIKHLVDSRINTYINTAPKLYQREKGIIRR